MRNIKRKISCSYCRYIHQKERPLHGKVPESDTNKTTEFFKLPNIKNINFERNADNSWSVRAEGDFDDKTRDSLDRLTKDPESSEFYEVHKKIESLGNHLM